MIVFQKSLTQSNPRKYDITCDVALSLMKIDKVEHLPIVNDERKSRPLFF